MAGTSHSASSLIGLDTNVLLRYFVAPGPVGSDQRQSSLATELMESGRPLRVCKTVILEMEWVLRGVYGYAREEIGAVLSYLLDQPHIDVEDHRAVRQAAANYAAGLDFADALHHASYAACTQVVSFDDRSFARRSDELKLQPPLKLAGKSWR